MYTTYKEREKTALQYTPMDVIAGVLVFVDKKFFTGNPETIHVTIHRLKEKYRGTKIMDAFAFSANDVYPFSRQLEKALFRLQRSRIIGMENPDFERFIIKKRGTNYIKKEILPRFGREEKKVLKEMGKEFSKACGGDL